MLDDVRERIVAQEEELEALKKQHREDATQLLSLTRQLTFSHAEERRLRHLASSKNLAASKTKTTFAKMSAEKLTQLNLAKTRSDARGDDLAASIVDLKRHHTKREGELVSQVEDLTSEIGLLKAEIAVKKHAHESASERCEENLSKNSVMVADMNEMKETERVMKRAKEVRTLDPRPHSYYHLPPLSNRCAARRRRDRAPETQDRAGRGREGARAQGVEGSVHQGGGRERRRLPQQRGPGEGARPAPGPAVDGDQRRGGGGVRLPRGGRGAEGAVHRAG